MAESDSHDLVEQLFSPLSLEAFLAEHRHRQPLHLRGAPGRFADLFDWDRLSRILRYTPLDAHRLALARGGKTLDPATYIDRTGGVSQLDAGKALMQLRGGATLLLNLVQECDAEVARLCDALAQVLDSRVGANAYAAWEKTSSFGLHWDDHDVLILQVAGSKQWTVHAPTRVDPLEGDVAARPPAAAEPWWSGVLEDGDVLYLPRGWWLLPEASEGPSLHLTLSLERPAAVHYLAWLAQDLRADERLRGDIPQFGDDTAAQAGWLDDLRAGFSQAIDADSLAAFLAGNLQSHARPDFALPGLAGPPADQWDPDTRLKLFSDSRLVVRERDGAASIVDGKAELPCHPHLAPALRRLSGHEWIALSELETLALDAPPGSLRTTLGMLADFGKLTAR